MRWRYIILLIVLYGVYLLIGAAIFYALEFANEESECNKTMQELQAAFDKVGTNLSNNATFNGDDLRNLIRVIREAPSNGVQFYSNQTASCAHNWNYHNAFFFAGTVVTTIGYGNISPRTSGGQTFCIFYAMIGIPLFGIMFSAIGDKIAKIFTKLDSKIAKKTKRETVRKLIVIMATVAALFLFFCIVPAFIFTAVEKWNFHEAFYYSFITLTTIGFGDFVAGSNADLSYSSVYRIGVYFWILFGLAFMATVISLTGDAIKDKAEGKPTKKDTEENGEDNASGRSVQMNDINHYSEATELPKQNTTSIDVSVPEPLSD